MDSHFLLQGIFPTQGLNPCLLHWQAGSFPWLGLPSFLYTVTLASWSLLVLDQWGSAALQLQFAADALLLWVTFKVDCVLSRPTNGVEQCPGGSLELPVGPPKQPGQVQRRHRTMTLGDQRPLAVLEGGVGLCHQYRPLGEKPLSLCPAYQPRGTSWDQSDSLNIINTASL